MTTIENQIQHILQNTTDAALGLTISDMGIQAHITEASNELIITLYTGFPTAFLEKTILTPLNVALAQAFPQHTVHLTLKQEIRSHRTQMPGKQLRGVKNTIAIASGKGGVGKSTVTVNLAVALARAGARVGILDADIYGPSIPLMLGHTAPVEICEENYVPVFAHGVHAMSIGYLTGEQPLIWRGPMLGKSLLQLINLTTWDELDYLFIDLPPGTGDIQLSLVQKIPLTGAIIVTTPQTVATRDAQKALTMFERTGINVLGVIENMSIHVCSQCAHQEAVFGEGGAQALCHTHQCPLLGQLPLNSQIGVQCDQGSPTAANGTDPLAMAFINTALRAAIEVAKMPINYADKFPPIITE